MLKIIVSIVSVFVLCRQVAAQDEKSFKFRGDLSNRYDKVYRFVDQGRLVLTDHFRMQFNLGMEAKISKSLKVEAVATATKYWNQWLTQNSLDRGVYNLNTDDKYRDDQIHLSQAYFNYSPIHWFSLWGGRLPTVGGAPASFYDTRSSPESYFPKLLFGSEVDGGIGFLHLDDFDFYVGYIPYLLQNFNYSTSNTDQKPVGSSGVLEAETLAPRATAGIRYINNDLAWAKEFIGHLNYGWLNYLRFPDATLPASFFDPSLSGSSYLSSDLSISLTTLAIHFQVKEPIQLPIALSVTYLMTSLKSSGDVEVTSGAGSGRRLGGYGTQNSEDTLNGGVLLLAGKGKLASFWLGQLSLGSEWLRNQRNGFYFDRFADDPSQFYSTRGEAWHLYLLQELTDGLHIRGGFRRQELSYGFWSVGDTLSDHSRYDTYYIDVKALL